MATSGTVGTTTIDTATLLEHACRRIGLPAGSQTPETVSIGKQNLYLLLLNLANRGLNLWCVEKDILATQAGKAVYSLPLGSLRTLNVLYGTPNSLLGADTTSATSITTQMSAGSSVTRFGFSVTATVTGTMVLEVSDDNVTWTTAHSTVSTAWTAGTAYIYDVDPAAVGIYFRLTCSVACTFSEYQLYQNVTELPVVQWNRDDFANQPDKTKQGRPVTNYYFDKTLTPSISCWPVPNTSWDHLVVFRHRQVQDIGALTQQVEVPQQWMEAIIWQLASRLSYELPNIDPGRRQEVVAMAERYLMDGELGESDNAPIYWVPGVSVYTR